MSLDTPKKLIPRRRFLRTLSIGSGAAVLNSALRPVVALTAPAVKKFPGVQLTALLIGGGAYERLYTRIPMWEGRTGAKVDSTARMAHREMITRVAREYASGRPTFDWHSDHTGTWKNVQRFLVPLNEYVDPGDLKDFSTRILDASSEEGKLWIMPRHADIQLTYYRRDLFDNPTERQQFKAKYGYDLKVPATWKEWRDTAEFFTRLPDLFGFAWAASGSSQFFWEQLVNAGGRVFDERNRPAWNSPEGVRTLQFLVDLYKAVAPPGSVGYQWDDLAQLFRQGRLAFYFEWGGWYTLAKDPQQSRVYDKFDVARRPAGPAGTAKLKTWGEAHAFAIAGTSAHKEASADVINFLTSSDNEFFEAKEGGYIPVRGSAWQRLKEDVLKSPDPRDRKRLALLEEAIRTYFWPISAFHKQIPGFNGICYPILQPLIEKAFLGQMRSEEVLAQSAREVEAQLAQRGLLK